MNSFSPKTQLDHSETTECNEMNEKMLSFL